MMTLSRICPRAVFLPRRAVIRSLRVSPVGTRSSEAVIVFAFGFFAPLILRGFARATTCVPVDDLEAELRGLLRLDRELERPAVERRALGLDLGLPQRDRLPRGRRRERRARAAQPRSAARSRMRACVRDGRRRRDLLGRPRRSSPCGRPVAGDGASCPHAEGVRHAPAARGGGRRRCGCRRRRRRASATSTMPSRSVSRAGAAQARAARLRPGGPGRTCSGDGRAASCGARSGGGPAPACARAAGARRHRRRGSAASRVPRDRRRARQGGARRCGRRGLRAARTRDWAPHEQDRRRSACRRAGRPEQGEDRRREGRAQQRGQLSLRHRSCSFSVTAPKALPPR